MLTIEIDNKDGIMWNLSGIVSEASYKTSRLGQASTFEFTLIKGGLYEDKDFKYTLGDVVRVKYDDVPVFYGYIFSIDDGRDENVKITAFDQLRYLMMNDTYYLTDITATQLIQRIANDFKLKLGKLDDTEFQLPKVSESNAKLMDIICKALDKTLIATTRLYVLFDDFGELSLREAKNLTMDFSIGDNSLLYDYKTKSSIDNAYNRIKIVKDNKEKGVREVYIQEDSSHIAKWGLLQMYQVADEKSNEEQINQSLNNLLKLNNRIKRTLSIDALGDARVRAGCYVSLNVNALGLNQYFLVDECTHKFDGTDHTMSLDLVDIRIGDDKL